MIEQDVEIIVQRAREKFPKATPRIISDNEPQFIAKNFKEFIRSGMSHVRTSPFYPPSNGKLERYHKPIKTECIRSKVLLSVEAARSMAISGTTTMNACIVRLVILRPRRNRRAVTVRFSKNAIKNSRRTERHADKNDRNCDPMPISTRFRQVQTTLTR
jgi:transposase InsO family protein